MSTLIMILVIILIIYVLWLIFNGDKGNQEGSRCRRDEDCQLGLFCGGPGVCVTGRQGGRQGDYCRISEDCEVGMSCNNRTCVWPRAIHGHHGVTFNNHCPQDNHHKGDRSPQSEDFRKEEVESESSDDGSESGHYNSNSNYDGRSRGVQSTSGSKGRDEDRDHGFDRPKKPIKRWHRRRTVSKIVGKKNSSITYNRSGVISRSSTLPQPSPRSVPSRSPLSPRDSPGESMNSTTKIPSFNEQTISVDDKKSRYYLDVPLKTSSSNSNWISNPSQVFTYDSRTGYIKFKVIGSSMEGWVSVNSDGSLISSSEPSKFTIVANSVGIVIVDSYGNELGVGLESFFPLATFNDHSHYTESPNDMRVAPTTVQFNNR